MNPEIPKSLFPEVYNKLLHLARLLFCHFDFFAFVKAKFLEFVLQAQITL